MDQPDDNIIPDFVAFVVHDGKIRPEGIQLALDGRVRGDIEAGIFDAPQLILDAVGRQVQHLRGPFINLPVIDGIGILKHTVSQHDTAGHNGKKHDGELQLDPQVPVKLSGVVEQFSHGAAPPVRAKRR
ncbi:hypothetical protein D3C75_1056270 [compost metagenome]